ncbi:MAG: SAM-dependent chlorinase/fluorinase [Deltaproteobacteria bacterium]|nr:SAM-dependent chlorinase/fluorinase [Deltaproteobacteria bacterium]
MKSFTRFSIASFLVFSSLFTVSCSLPFLKHTPVEKEAFASKKIIALLTDLGSKDFYVGAMKGIIYSICPEVTVVDITHQITPYNLQEGSRTLYHTAKEFPPGTIFVAVVDPVTGTKRRPMVLLTLDGKYFVGPDNGIFSLVFREVGVRKIYQIKNPKWLRQKGVSKTFHGRDIFAPVAAHLAAGWPVEEVGPEIKAYSLLSSKPAKRRGNRIEGEVTAADRYGNVILNIPGKLFEEFGIKRGTRLQVHFKNKKLMIKWAATYGEVPEGEGVILISGGGFLELAVNRGNAARKYGLEVGEAVILEKPD